MRETLRYILSLLCILFSGISCAFCMVAIVVAIKYCSVYDFFCGIIFLIYTSLFALLSHSILKGE